MADRNPDLDPAKVRQMNEDLRCLLRDFGHSCPEHVILEAKPGGLIAIHFETDEAADEFADYAIAEGFPDPVEFQ